MLLFCATVIISVAVLPVSLFAQRDIARVSALTPQRKSAIKDSLSKRYKSIEMPYKERVKTLLNVYDLCYSYEDMISTAKEILDVGKAAKDVPLQLQALRYLGSFNVRIDSLQMGAYLNYCASLPVSNDQRETFQFLRYQIAIQGMNMGNNKITSESLLPLINDYSERKKSDIYYRVGDLFILCKYVSLTTTGKLYTDYLNTLGKLIEKLPEDGRAVLPAVYYNVLFAFYLNQGMLKEAHKANRDMLLYINQLDARNIKNGRIYRSYDSFRYVYFRKECQLGSDLSRAEINKDYKMMEVYSHKDWAAYYDFNSDISPGHLYYYMAIKDYKNAIPLIDKVLDSDADSNKWMVSDCLKFRVHAGDSVKGNNIDKYLLKYISQKEDIVSGDIEGRTRELQTIYDINSFKQKAAKRNLKMAGMVLVFLIVLLLITLRLLKTSRKTELSLKQNGLQLEKEKNILASNFEMVKIAKEMAENDNNMKTKFLQNVNRDIKRPLDVVVGFSQLLVESQKEMSDADAEKYSDLISKNGQILLKIVEDILESASKNV